MFGPIGMPELIIILTIALIIFGPRKLPELGRSLGKSIHEFKKASNELRSTLDEEIRLEEQRTSEQQRAFEQQRTIDQQRTMDQQRAAEAPTRSQTTEEQGIPRQTGS